MSLMLCRVCGEPVQKPELMGDTCTLKCAGIARRQDADAKRSLQRRLNEKKGDGGSARVG